MKDITQALRDFTRLFDQLGMAYAVMGGLAVRLYGIPRATYDVDFTLAVDRPHLPHLFEAVKQLGYVVPEVYESGWVDQVGGMPLVKFQLTLEDEAIDIDVFLAESAYQKELLSRRRREDAEFGPVWFVSPEDLILLKLLASRPRDHADILDVLFTQGQLDEAYMRHWADRLGVREVLEKIFSEPPGV